MPHRNTALATLQFATEKCGAGILLPQAKTCATYETLSLVRRVRHAFVGATDSRRVIAEFRHDQVVASGHGLEGMEAREMFGEFVGVFKPMHCALCTK